MTPTLLCGILLMMITLIFLIYNQLVLLEYAVSQIEQSKSEHLAHLNDRFDRLQETLSALDEQLARWPQQPPETRFQPPRSSFEQASKMIEMGATLQEITQACHLKPQEAELIWSMSHAHKTSQIARKLAQSPWYTSD